MMFTAYAQEETATEAMVLVSPPEAAPAPNPATDPTWLATVIAVVVGTRFILKGLGEGLTIIAVKTANTWDNKLADTCSKIAWHLGNILGKFDATRSLLNPKEPPKDV